jgi:hypothetical protein
MTIVSKREEENKKLRRENRDLRNALKLLMDFPSYIVQQYEYVKKKQENERTALWAIKRKAKRITIILNNLKGQPIREEPTAPENTETLKESLKRIGIDEDLTKKIENNLPFNKNKKLIEDFGSE